MKKGEIKMSTKIYNGYVLDRVLSITKGRVPRP